MEGTPPLSSSPKQPVSDSDSSFPICLTPGFLCPSSARKLLVSTAAGPQLPYHPKQTPLAIVSEFPLSDSVETPNVVSGFLIVS